MELCCLRELWRAGSGELEMSAEMSCKQKHVTPGYARWIRSFPRMARGEQCCVNIRNNVKFIRPDKGAV